MRPTRGVLPSLVLLLTLAAPVLAGCGSPAPPGGSPTPSSTATPTTTPAATPTPSPTPTSTQAPTTTSPGPQWTVVAARVAYQWQWPGGSSDAVVGHSTTVPPVPRLVTIGAANHPNEPNDRPYNRMSFSFTNGFPSYRFRYVSHVTGDGSGLPVELDGLRIVFTPAQAHNDDGRSTIVSQPPAHLGLNRMTSYVQAGDFEGYLTYGIGMAWPIPESNPQFQVRVYEVTYTDGAGNYRYVVAVDIDSADPTPR